MCRQFFSFSGMVDLLFCSLSKVHRFPRQPMRHQPAVVQRIDLSIMFGDGAACPVVRGRLLLNSDPRGGGFGGRIALPPGNSCAPFQATKAARNFRANLCMAGYLSPSSNSCVARVRRRFVDCGEVPPK